jgi:hypothetical protein
MGSGLSAHGRGGELAAGNATYGSGRVKEWGGCWLMLGFGMLREEFLSEGGCRFGLRRLRYGVAYE